MLSNDPVAAGLARLAKIRHAALPAAGFEGWLAHTAEEGRHLFVLDQAHANEGPAAGLLEALEEGWFAPLLEALRADRIGMATVHVPDAGRRWETTRGDLRRFWRRTKPNSPKGRTTYSFALYMAQNVHRFHEQPSVNWKIRESASDGGRKSGMSYCTRSSTDPW